MSAIVTGLPVSYLSQVWPSLWPMLAPAVKRSPVPLSVLPDLLAHKAQLWGIYDRDTKTPVAAIVTRITVENETGEKRCFLWLVGGSRVREWAKDFLETLDGWAREHDCTALWGSGRAGWDRIVKKLGAEAVDPIDGYAAWVRRL